MHCLFWKKLILLFIFKSLFVYLKIRETEIFHSWFIIANSHNCQDWARPKPRVRKFIQVSLMGGRGSKYLGYRLLSPSLISRKLTWKYQADNLNQHFDVGCRHPKDQFNPTHYGICLIRCNVSNQLNILPWLSLKCGDCSVLKLWKGKLNNKFAYFQRSHWLASMSELFHVKATLILIFFISGVY